MQVRDTKGIRVLRYVAQGWSKLIRRLGLCISAAERLGRGPSARANQIMSGQVAGAQHREHRLARRLWSTLSAHVTPVVHRYDMLSPQVEVGCEEFHRRQKMNVQEG